MRKAAAIAVTAALLASAVPVFASSECGVDPVYDRNTGGTVTTGARVRDIACMEGSVVLTTIPVGERVTIIGETDGWWKVRTASGVVGWVGDWLISPGGDPVISPASSPVVYETAPTVGLIKRLSDAAVYYVVDGKRYAFPNDRVFSTWYANFSAVVVVTEAEVARHPLAGLVTYRPGIRLVKITTDPRVYAVSRYGVLRWITSESAAASLYGSDWNTKVHDIPDAFFVNYLMGSPIVSAAEFSVEAEGTTVSVGDNIRPVGFAL